MKYLKAILIFAVFLAAADLATPAGACAPQGDAVKVGRRFGEIIAITFECTGDAADGSVSAYDMSGYSQLLGGWPYEIETLPASGAETPIAYTVELQNTRGTTLHSLSARSTTEKQTEVLTGGFKALDVAPVLVVGNLGASNKTTIIVKFSK